MDVRVISVPGTGHRLDRRDGGDYEPDPGRFAQSVSMAIDFAGRRGGPCPGVVLASLAAMQGPKDPPKTDIAKTPLPPRALLRIGTDDLRTTDFITAFAFSPDGRLVAAADANAPSPRVVIFDVRTGREVKQIVAPGESGGWCRVDRVLAGRHEIALGRV